MTTKSAEWASELRQITMIRPPDASGGKSIPTAVQSGYGWSGFVGYLGNVGLDDRDGHENLKRGDREYEI
jgi:hypothetical protein